MVAEDDFTQAEYCIECDCGLMLSSADSPVSYDPPALAQVENSPAATAPSVQKWYLASWHVGGRNLGDTATTSIFASQDEVKFYKWMNATRPGEWKTEIDTAEAIRLLRAGHGANRSTKNLLAELITRTP